MTEVLIAVAGMAPIRAMRDWSSDLHCESEDFGEVSVYVWPIWIKSENEQQREVSIIINDDRRDGDTTLFLTPFEATRLAHLLTEMAAEIEPKGTR
jgi:hypothetical protein